MLDGEALGNELTEIVKGYVARATAPLLERIDLLERRAPETGAKGDRGEAGERGADGVNGKDGKDGAPGRDGIDGAKGDPGRDGADGAPGRGIAKLLIDSKGHLVVTYTDGATDDVGLIVGKDGADGRDGADGLPGQKGDPGQDGRDGLDGKDGAPGRDGKDGLDGKSVEIETVAELVRAEVEKAGIGDLVQRAVDAIPRPRDGVDGKDGAKGQDGAPGRDGLDGKDGAPGRDGIDGKDGLPGKDGERGEKGDPGKDGIGLADAMIDREGNLILTMTDGRHKMLGAVLGKDGVQGPQGERGEPGSPGAKGDPGERGMAGEKGEPGKDGADGFGFDDLVVDYDDERTITLRFQKGDRIKEYPLTLPIVLDKGVWQDRGPEGSGYQKGDGVTWGGQFYIARKQTFAKPDDHEAWRLSVKRGRDAKEPVKING